MRMRMAVHHNYYRVLLEMIILLFCPIQTSSRQLSCSYRCGNATILYPFGIKAECYFNKSFEVLCSNDSSGHQKAFLPSLNNLELQNTYVDHTAIVNIPVVSLNASEPTRNAKGIDLSGSPFTLSRRKNRLTIIGCDNYSTINHSTFSDFGQCLSICTCDPTYQDGGCYDFLCAIPENIGKVFHADISYIYSLGILQQCQSVSMVQEQWILSNYLKNPYILKDNIEQVPAVLEWGQYKGRCVEEYNTKGICNLDGRCLIELSTSYVCVCDVSSDLVSEGYCPGDLICKTDHDCSSCPNGYYYSSGYCYRRNYILEKSRFKLIIIGCTTGGFGLLFLLIGMWLLYKFLKRRREIKLKQKFFKRNGGLLLRGELSSNEGNILKTKLFTSKELVKATGNYNANRILGQGGQGTVYKGMLEDGKIVAVKKFKIVDESNVEQFINEVVILSQINHRNVVKLFGCCLETEVPLLVYEFIPNGTLFQHIHDQTDEFPLTWEMRLRIAVEVSGALCYLHSAASIPIYHRDIKSANILLDDKCRAKVSDFGTSRSITIDQTHLTTQVQGTFGYVDPEYFQSSQFTEKSDVYSFGVVLVELLTGQKPIRNSINSEEYRSLAAYFLQAMEDNHLSEILDGRVLKEAEKEEIITVAMLAKRCLSLNGKKRPTMIEVAVELGGHRGSNVPSFTPQNTEEIDFVNGDITGPFETDSSSTSSVFNTVVFSQDVDPLISEKV